MSDSKCPKCGSAKLLYDDRIYTCFTTVSVVTGDVVQSERCKLRCAERTIAEKEKRIAELVAELRIIDEMRRQADLANESNLDTIARAHECAQWLFDTMKDCVSEDFVREAIDRWKWLEDAK